MSKHRSSPLVRVWYCALLVLGILVALQLALQVLAQIWGWLLLIGLLVLAVGILMRILRVRRNRW